MGEGRGILGPTPKYMLLLLAWPAYFAAYLLTEHWIPAENCIAVHCALDDRIGFCEWFVVPYVGWYFLVAASLVFFLMGDAQNFINLQTYLIVTQVLAVLVYILIPTRQDLRPQEFARENVLTDTVRLLYSIDTSTGVCPSLHCAFSIGVASVWLRKRDAARWFKALIVLFAVLVCMSTVFIKQHSVLDFCAAVPVCLAAEWFVFIRGKNHPETAM